MYEVNITKYVFESPVRLNDFCSALSTVVA